MTDAILTKSGASNWGGVVVNSGGSLIINPVVNNTPVDNRIEYALTGLKLNNGSSLSIPSGETLEINNCSNRGLHIYHCSPTVERIHIDTVTSHGILIEGSSSSPTLRNITIQGSYYGVYVGSYADAQLYDNYLHSNTDNCIHLSASAGLNLENITSGDNSINPAVGEYAVFNYSSNGTIYADYNYWGTDSPTSSLFNAANYIDEYEAPYHLDSHPAGAGAPKIASLVVLSEMEQAIQSEKVENYSQAYNMFRNILLTSSDPQSKRRALKYLLRIEEKTNKDYSDLKQLVASELAEYSGRNSYRAILDYIACELLYREGKIEEAIAAFNDKAPYYDGTPMKVEMYCRIAELYGELGDKNHALVYANRAAAINPGQSSLMSAFEVASIKYNPMDHENRFELWDGQYSNIPIPKKEYIDTTENSIVVLPNPANPIATIRYTIANPSNVTLNIYSVTGQKVATLVDDHLNAGTHSVKFDGSRLGSGVYFYHFKSGSYKNTGKILLMK